MVKAAGITKSLSPLSMLQNAAKEKSSKEASPIAADKPDNTAPGLEQSETQVEVSKAAPPVTIPVAPPKPQKAKPDLLATTIKVDKTWLKRLKMLGLYEDRSIASYFQEALDDLDKKIKTRLDALPKQ